ncbi:MAG TPA: hypothetical protein VFH80_17580, partial [Solirubrobacteraceae bacterium]|nr:hypothetical protein [Solirubrobacteraceae bacterium]
RRIGAYLALGERHLYEVVELYEDGTVMAQNVRTGYHYTMSVTNLRRARLVTPLPDEETADLEALVASVESPPEAA